MENEKNVNSFLSYRGVEKKFCGLNFLQGVLIDTSKLFLKFRPVLIKFLHCWPGSIHKDRDLRITQLN